MIDIEELVYTEAVKKAIYTFKPKLPRDFELQTRIESDSTGDDLAYFIVICVPMSNFEWRTVEDRLEIALTLEQIRTEIEKAGARCVIEKT